MKEENFFLATKYRKGGYFKESNEVETFFKNAEGLSEENPIRVYLQREDFLVGGAERHRYVVSLDKEGSENSKFLILLDEEQHFVDDKFGILDISDNKKLDEMLTSPVSAFCIGKLDNSFIIKAVSEEVKKKEKKEEKGYEKENDLLIQNLISSGIMSEDNISERKDYLTNECGIEFNSKVFNEYLKLIRPQKGDNISRPNVLYKGVGKGASKNLVRKMIVHLTGGTGATPHNIILQGAKSTGKNVAWETVAWLINAQIIPMTCSNRMTRSDMFGHAATDNGPKEAINKEGAEALLNSLDKTDGYKWKEEGAKFLENVCKTLSPSLVLTPGPITRAMQIANAGNGVILLLNEFNYSDPNTIAGAINDLIDRHSKYLYITDLGNTEISDKLIVGATQNQTGGEYIGTQEQNDALMSRFCCISLDSGTSIAPVLKENAPDADEDVIEVLDNIYGEYYKLTLEGVSESCLNIRGFIAALEEISMGEEIAEAVKECVINTVQAYDDWAVLEEVIDNILE